MCSRPDSLMICAGSSEQSVRRVWEHPKMHIPQLPISARNTAWCIPCQQLPDSCWSEYHQRVARWGIFLISFGVCSAVDIPSLNPSLCSSKNWKCACPGTKSCPHLGKESKWCCLQPLKCYSECGDHALFSSPRNQHLWICYLIFTRAC